MRMFHCHGDKSVAYFAPIIVLTLARNKFARALKRGESRFSPLKNPPIAQGSCLPELLCVSSNVRFLKCFGYIWNATLAPLLGFKGGTCAYFFYNLPRFSVDLDFDLLPSEKQHQEIFATVCTILKAYGTLKDARIKRYTIFALLSYGDADCNIKVEINIRNLEPNIRDYFVCRKYLGISMLAAKKTYLFTCKLIALTSRNTVAMRDVYDIYFFAKNNWDIDAAMLQNRTGKNLHAYLSNCIALVEQIKNNQILSGLGELISSQEKTRIKAHLKEEVLFMLRNYLSAFVSP